MVIRNDTVGNNDPDDGGFGRDDRDELGVFDPVAWSQNCGLDDAAWTGDASECEETDRAELEDTRDSYHAIETLFQRVRLPDEVSEYIDGIEPAFEKTEATRLDLLGFREERVLGLGGFGTVFLAHDEKLQRSVAIKVPRADRWLMSDDQSRLLEEARLAAKLKHPGIVTLHELVQHNDRYHIVSEFVEGETLQDLLEKEQRLPWRKAVQLVTAMANALAHAHENRVIHRDIKPTNVLLTQSGEPKIGDFGLAIRHEAGNNTKALAAGTIEYMSPEQLPTSESAIDHRTDIWSLGVVFYELLTGVLPFTGLTRSELFNAIASGEVVSPRQIEPSVPRDVAEICLKCLNKMPFDRYPSAAELANELQRASAKTRYTPLGILARAAIAAVLVASLFFAWSSLFGPSQATMSSELSATLTVNHLRFSDDRKRAIDFGTLGEYPYRVQQNDSVNLSIQFNQPAYYRLFEFANDGLVNLLAESKPDDEPVRSIEFPGANADIRLSDFPGSCVLAVVCSQHPLAPLTETQLSEIVWDGGQHEGIWQFDNGRFLQVAVDDRGSIEKRPEAPVAIQKACKQLMGDSVTVTAIAFPVESPDGGAP
ncbi:MAG: serine/threonine protein kinase [Planctomycetales bacterium]|nr:serine/threonine protein kinase [Planctomycetales bacterium]